MSHLRRPFGLTGGVASGKTTVAQMFAELGAKTIDADRLGHELIRAPSPAYHEIVSRFGFEILDPQGEIDRQRLGVVAFGDPEKLRALNAILHPRIMERCERLAEGFHLQDPRAVVLVDAALIYEANLTHRFVKIIVTWCRPEQQLERLMARTGLSRAEAERRIAAQMPIDEKRGLADYVIDCSGELELTRRQVANLFPQLHVLDSGGKKPEIRN
ncbi:MAG: dephospho-CoA kinase [Acidobacteriia bacterium]|nr:dephospho-CoA kinase [Terriglobia bacterium]